MNRAMISARTKLNEVIRELGMSGDFIINDTAHFADGKVTVSLSIDPISLDAKAAYASGKLRRNTYPGFERIYRDAMREEGFSSVTVQTLGNPFRR